ncbi:DUF1236 domain-containing protein [Agrobacterium vitis]|uniref:DUF1236 domain-containing protein n=1 Tax=Agrobacterium vitis TaxID=373 RepID=A0ABD6G8F7_AGRVI|nr:DUF1236 domain-containing protein [Agrobacterium vitis]MUO79730.1 DUF1236 domain-containing protein [Agrobacterium vitis]MUO93781.1 DUF1236 domain-containing protein [Agrobacterium vitis]MUP03968.1 DUF1236 domain-containing protein [Agrobacterium vitis]MVA91961.1 DUF1236 domain-containing protein [Agrobacterium vitis]MVB01470.1 DUF1236 domain-containing protein [Agrobacterium vitis]
MRKIIIASTAILASVFATTVNAQNSTVNGAAGGAVTGAIVGGPVGAAVGGVAGAIVGTAIDPPPREVVTYVQEQPVSAPVRVQQQVVVGKPIPETVVLTPVPSNEHYAYAVVNDQRVIVDP